jgi:alpha-L-fucosidase
LEVKTFSRTKIQPLNIIIDQISIASKEGKFMKIKEQYTAEDTTQAKHQATPEGVLKFQRAGYGLSVHWGLYSLSTQGTEWTYYRDQIPYDKYVRRMDRFSPTRFNADEWADLMLESGLKFLIITSKHHDGFCLWDTALKDFKVTRTPFGRDILAELANALHERGLGLHFYYSLVDWTYPAYRNDWEAYVDYYQGQIRELCSNFGMIDGIIFDGYWPRQEFDPGRETEYFVPRGPWDLAGTYDLIHELQPQAVIANNTHIPPLPGEDYQVWELDLPGENTTGFNTTEMGDKPTACWWNLNAGWSYQPWHHALKNAREIFDVYRLARAKDAVFFLNVGPRPFGDIHPDEQRVLREIGSLLLAEKT